MFKQFMSAVAALFFVQFLNAQTIGSFESIKPSPQIGRFQFSEKTHTFQVLLRAGEQLTTGGSMPSRHDFTGFVPVGGSSENGFVCINAEVNPSGDVTVLDVHFDKKQKKWLIDASEKVDFDPVEGTRNNCSGSVTPWGTVLTCEENKSTTRPNAAGFNRFGFCIEIDPVTKTVKNYDGGLPDGDKIWKMGFCNHENAVVRPDQNRVLYTGMDNPRGFLYKYVTDFAGELGAGRLFVLKKNADGTGHWLPLKNSTPAEVNRTIEQSEALGGSFFNGIEDVEIGPEGLVYFAVKGEGRVYRFKDENLLNTDYYSKISHFETFLGGKSYQTDPASKKLTPWGVGNDNLAFDPEGNLWVCQDGNSNIIWVVGKDHTQARPQVRIFGIAPAGAEPTGLTFSPDGRFGFMSFQHPAAENSTSQPDAFGQPQRFSRDVAIVFSRKEFLGNNLPATVLASQKSDFGEMANLIEWSGETEGHDIELAWITESEERLNHFIVERMASGEKWETIGTVAAVGTIGSESWYQFSDQNPWLGTNIYRLRQVGFDGKMSLSDVIQVGFFPKNRTNGGKIYPNPASSVINLQFAENPEGPAEIIVLNTLGVRKMTRNFSEINGSQLSLNIEKLRPGPYFLQARSGGKVLMTGRFSVN